MSKRETQTRQRELSVCVGGDAWVKPPRQCKEKQGGADNRDDHCFINDSLDIRGRRGARGSRGALRQFR